MADDIAIKSSQVPSSSKATSQADSFKASNEADSSKSSSSSMGLGTGEVMGEQEFLMLLVNQLQNQDPLNPMDSQEFSVQLAQFSQLEQLIGINEKMGTMTSANSADTSSVSSMASFLGRYVVLKDQTVSVQDGTGGEIMVDMPAGMQSARLDFIDAQGVVVGSKEVGDVIEGQQNVSLSDLDVPDGEYSIRVVGVNSNGAFQELSGNKAGLVEGFVLEPEPALLVNGMHVTLDQVAEVKTSEQKS